MGIDLNKKAFADMGMNPKAVLAGLILASMLFGSQYPAQVDSMILSGGQS